MVKSIAYAAFADRPSDGYSGAASTVDDVGEAGPVAIAEEGVVGKAVAATCATGDDIEVVALEVIAVDASTRS